MNIKTFLDKDASLCIFIRTLEKVSTRVKDLSLIIKNIGLGYRKPLER